MTEPHYSLDDAIHKLQLSWSENQQIQVEDLLKQYPDLSQDDSAVLDLIYTEVLLQEHSGRAAEEADYVQRFPELREQIAKQFQLHRALGNSPKLAELPTATGGATIPASDTNTLSHTQTLPQIPGFEILEIAGRGGSGVAYRAYDQQLKRTVAIKVLNTMTSQDDEHRQKLIREAEAAASLLHPSIVQVYHIGENNGLPYLVMEFIAGHSLAEALQAGPLSVDKTIDVVIQVARAIDHAHRSGIIHRDLKPANVLLDLEGHPHVCDFGLARQIESEFTLHATGDVMGTPAYMPPEQARGEGVTVASDVYSLGAVLYQCLTGRPPFLASTPWEIMTQVMTDDPPPLRQLNSSLPRDLETICSVALHKIPNRRYASAEILANELQRFRDGKPIEARPVGRLEKFWKLCKRHPATATLVSVSLIALIALATVSTISADRVSRALGETNAALNEAETQRDVAFDAMRRLVFQVHDDLQQRGASIEARGQVLESAIDGLQRLIDTKGGKDEITLAMSEARARLGFILSQQGRNDSAEDEYLQAIELAKSIKTDKSLLQTAQACSDLASFYIRINRPDDAIEMSRLTTSFLNQCDSAALEAKRINLVAAQANSHLGAAFFMKMQYPDALAARKQATQINRKLWEQTPNDRPIVLQLSESALQTAFLLNTMGRYGEAEEYLTEAIPLLRTQAAKSSEDQGATTGLYRALQSLGNIQFARMQFSEALENLTEALAGYQQWVDVEPNRPGFRLKLGALHRDTGYCLLQMNQVDEAISHTNNSIVELQKGMELGGEPYRVQRFSIVTGYQTLADLHLRNGDLSAAAQDLREAAEVALPIMEEYDLHEAVDVVLYQAECLLGMLGQDSKADTKDIQKSKRAYEIYKAAKSNNFLPLADSEQQMRADIEAVDHPAVKPHLVLILCQVLSLHFDFLSSSTDTKEEEIQAAKSKAIEAAKNYASLPNEDPRFYVNIPELTGLRQTEEFRSAFDLP